MLVRQPSFCRMITTLRGWVNTVFAVGVKITCMKSSIFWTILLCWWSSTVSELKPTNELLTADSQHNVDILKKERRTTCDVYFCRFLGMQTRSRPDILWTATLPSSVHKEGFYQTADDIFYLQIRYSKSRAHIWVCASLTVLLEREEKKFKSLLNFKVYILQDTCLGSKKKKNGLEYNAFPNISVVILRLWELLWQVEHASPSQETRGNGPRRKSNITTARNTSLIAADHQSLLDAKGNDYGINI